MSKLGNFVAILKIAGPGLLLAAGVPAPVIPFVVRGMEIAENSQKPGAEKKVIAMQALNVGAAAFEALGHYPGLEAAVDKGIDATVATIKVFADHDVAPVVEPNPTPAG